MNSKQTLTLLIPLFGAVLICVGCASEIRGMRGLNVVEPEFIEEEQRNPNSLKKFRAEVGDVMLVADEFGYQPSSNRFDAISIESTLEVVVDHRRHEFRFELPQGPYKLVAESSQGSFYRYIYPFGSRKSYGGLFVPSGMSKATDFFWWWYSHELDESFVPHGVYSVPLTRPIPVNRNEYLEPIDGRLPSGPIATLTYAGVANNQIRFVYKEFTAKGLARPAFTQEVILDYNPGGTYAYKSARFIVHEAGTTHISYTLLEGL